MRVGILFMKNLNDALRFADPSAATSEFRWLAADQYLEQDGRVRLAPGVSAELVAYANAHRLHPLGVVNINGQGKRADILIEKPIEAEYREMATMLFRQHAEFWCSDGRDTHETD